MEQIMTNIGTFFTSATGWVTELVDIIANNPLLLIMCVGVPIVGVCFGYLGRLFRT